jgi:hypothetical protein
VTEQYLQELWSRWQAHPESEMSKIVAILLRCQTCTDRCSGIAQCKQRAATVND